MARRRLDLAFPIEDKGALIDRLYQLMSDAMGPVANYLMERGAGPTFEVYELGHDPATTVKALAKDVAGSRPDLSDVAKVVSGF